MTNAEIIKSRDGKIDIRDDEDQSVKLSEIVQLLVAAGYFRARIKGLSPFDKIVGGMTWCIETCNFDVDVDLLFHENLTIGHKIALTERIVRVLPLMKCPHRIEPHQIQGLDAIHIFPVIQWLVKRALETRSEYGDQTRSFALAEFEHNYSTQEDDYIHNTQDRALQTIRNVQTIYGPKRRLKKKPGVTPTDPHDRVKMTLLEYGHHFSASHTMTGSPGEDVADGDKVEADQMVQLLQKMDQTESTQVKLSASQIGQIVSGRAEEIVEVSHMFSQMQEQLQDEILGDNASSQIRLVESLEKQKSQLNEQLTVLTNQRQQLVCKQKEGTSQLQLLKEEKRELELQIKGLGGLVDTSENKQLMVELERLVELNEAARKKETTFKETCRKQAEKLKDQINALDNKVNSGDASRELLDKYIVEKERHGKMRLKLALKTRQIETLKRCIDDVPGRAELSQYQRRFVELYNQIAATHRETQQFYNMYNTLADSKTYMEKEQTLLNSILDNMTIALKDYSTLEDFIHQLDTIVDGIRQNKQKLERRQSEEKGHRSSLSGELSRLQELNRQYAKTVHILAQEISKNEMLQDRVGS